MTRLLCAEPGTDSQVIKMLDVIDGDFSPQAPWRHLGIASELPSPTITIRSSLRAIVFPAVNGDWPNLDELGVATLFSLAIMQAQDGHLIVNVVAAAIDHMQVNIAGDEYRGRVDFQFLGEVRALEAKP